MTRHEFSPLGAIWVAGLMIGAGCSKGGTVSLEWVEYVNAERPGNSNVLRATPDGLCRLHLRFNAGLQNAGEIGMYEAQVRPDDIAELTRAVANPPFSRIPDATGRIPAGSSHRIVRLNSGTSVIEKVAPWDGPVDPALSKLITKLESWMTTARAHPRRVLLVSIERASITARQTVTISVALRNKGRELVRVRNPQGVGNAASVQLEVEAWPDRPGVRAEDVVRGVVSQVETEPAGPSPDALAIAAGAAETFRFAAVLPWQTRGPHQIRVHFSVSPQLGSGDSELTGELYTAPVSISVP